MTIFKSSLAKSVRRFDLLVNLEQGKADDEEGSTSTCSDLSETESSDKAVVTSNDEMTNLAQSRNALPSRIVSSSALVQMTQESASEMPMKKRLKRSESEYCFNPKPLTEESKPTLSRVDAEDCMKPEAYLNSIMESYGVSISMFKTRDDSFKPFTKQQTNNYHKVAPAARNGDLQMLKELHDQGVSLQCSNNYGESILHIVCRRGHDSLLKFLMQSARASVRVKDDLGRTPLHDAAWTNYPNFDIVKMILWDSPDLLFVSDKRGHLPFDYVPRQHWKRWCRFLDESKDLMDHILQLIKKEAKD